MDAQLDIFGGETTIVPARRPAPAAPPAPTAVQGALFEVIPTDPARGIPAAVPYVEPELF